MPNFETLEPIRIGGHSSKQFRVAEFPQFIKYMGSKRKILDFVIQGINQVYQGGSVCDLFAGSSCLSGALGNQVPIISNDIQNYSSVLAGAYLMQDGASNLLSADELISLARPKAKSLIRSVGHKIDFKNISNRKEFIKVEEAARLLYSRPFRQQFHLFTRIYSGTWWSAEQCAWIDAIRAVADEQVGHSRFLILATLMHAMAYCSQGTGHFAQYRDANTDSAFKDINVYRKRSIADYFVRKWNKDSLPLASKEQIEGHKLMAVDYAECLQNVEPCTVYADPPYCFVHYSRFYHALETLVLYDHPEIQRKAGKKVKGRYRTGRHQSPFSIQTQVSGAFKKLFEGIDSSGSNLVLSYSNTGMITLDELVDLAETELGHSSDIEVETMSHTHMTMGRRNDRDREVTEVLILVKQK